MGRGGGGAPLYMQFELFPLWHEQTYFFLKRQLFFEGPRDRIFPRFFAGMLGTTKEDQTPSFIIFGHP